MQNTTFGIYKKSNINETTFPNTTFIFCQVIGPRTRRNIDTVLKAGIAKEAAKGKIARSCSKVVASLGRFAGRLSPMAHPQKNAYRLQVETPKAYLNNAIAHDRAADW